MDKNKIIIAAIILVSLFSCRKEQELSTDPDGVFELVVSPEMQDFIYDSRDTSFTIDEPGIMFTMDDQALDLDEIRIRGRTALFFQRKSYMVKLKQNIELSTPDGSLRKNLNRFKLISMAMDYTYIEHRIGYGLLEDQGIMPLFYRFVELKINGSTQGIYLLVEDPEAYFKDHGSEYIARRGYMNSITDSEYEPLLHFIPREDYESRFGEIYAKLPLLNGEALYEDLNKRLNLEQYFKKMGIDYLLQNGDYTDELYLYALVQQNQIRFNIIPWDYDDLFRDHPHEVGKNWGTGTLFGDRYYDSHQDILDEIGDKLVFSIEDDLDYIIAMDPYLYDRYLSCIKSMLEQLEESDMDALFKQLRQELLPYYNREEVVEQSRFDQDETNFILWEENMEEKLTFIKRRLETMREQAYKIQP